MVVVVQRVREASVCRKAEPNSPVSIGRGYVLLVGVAAEDTESDVRRLATQVSKVRLTLLADFAKGNRPSFHKAARSDAARPLFDLFVRELEREIGRSVPTGFFGEDMEVRLSNDGPVTVVLY
jgi:D-tyrosyl-tRNA(Tyr) deacylase